MAPKHKNSRSCICKIVFRFLAMIFTLAVIAISKGTDVQDVTWPYLVAPGVAALWSLIDLVLLCVRYEANPLFSIVIDIIFTLALGLFGGMLAVTAAKLDDRWKLPLMTVCPIYIVAAVWHLVLFVLAIVTHRQNRRHQKTRYRPDEYSMQNGTAETLLPIQERPVVNGYSAF